MTAPVETTAAPAPAAGGGAPPGASTTRRGPVAWIGVLAVTFSAVVGSNVFGLRDHFFKPATPKAAAPALGRDASTPAQTDLPAANAPTSLRSQPWWQDVTTLQGTGTATTSQFTIVSSAVQWRAKATCSSGRIVVRAPNQTRPVIDAACASEVTGFGSRSGPMSVDVTADGPWTLAVAQQIDSPLVEPPLPAMTAPGATAIRTGSFYNIDKSGIGKVTVYRQADGKYSLRLDDFFVSPNADLQLRLSTVDSPRSSQDYINGSSELIVVMDVTAGSLNYPVPAGVDPTKFKSVVVWCSPVSSAYAAAPLGVVR